LKYGGASVDFYSANPVADGYFSFHVGVLKYSGASVDFYSANPVADGYFSFHVGVLKYSGASFLWSFFDDATPSNKAIAIDFIYYFLIIFIKNLYFNEFIFF
jgi:hypothetical protein